MKEKTVIDFWMELERALRQYVKYRSFTNQNRIEELTLRECSDGPLQRIIMRLQKRGKREEQRLKEKIARNTERIERLRKKSRQWGTADYFAQEIEKLGEIDLLNQAYVKDRIRDIAAVVNNAEETHMQEWKKMEEEVRTLVEQAGVPKELQTRIAHTCKVNPGIKNIRLLAKVLGDVKKEYAHRSEFAVQIQEELGVLRSEYNILYGTEIAGAETQSIRETFAEWEKLRSVRKTIAERAESVRGRIEKIHASLSILTHIETEDRKQIESVCSDMNRDIKHTECVAKAADLIEIEKRASEYELYVSETLDKSFSSLLATYEQLETAQEKRPYTIEDITELAKRCRFLIERKQIQQKIIETIREVLRILEEKRVFDKKASDPKRLFGNSLCLLSEEKTRKKMVVTLSRLRRELIRLFNSYKKEYGVRAAEDCEISILLKKDDIFGLQQKNNSYCK